MKKNSPSSLSVPSRHIFFLYDNEVERRENCLPFIADAIRDNYRILYIHGHNSREAIIEWLDAGNIPVGQMLANEQIILCAAAESYGRDGKFDPERNLGNLNKFIGDSARMGYAGFLVTGEMLPEIGGMENTPELIKYEISVNTLLHQFPVTAVCQYNRRDFPPGILQVLLITHQEIVVHGETLPNPDYCPPDEFLNQDPHIVLLENNLNSLRMRKLYDQQSEQMQHELEDRVQARTAELIKTNHRLEQEIEQRILLEAALQQDEETLKAIFNSSPYPTLVWQIQPGGIFLQQVNQEACLVQDGRALQEIGARVEEFFKESPAFADMVQQTATSGLQLSGELNCLYPTDPISHHYYAHTTRVRSNMVVQTLIDITGVKQAAEKLIKSQTELQALINHAQDAIFLFDDNGTLLIANPAGCELLGYTADELPRSSLFHHLTDDSENIQLWHDFQTHEKLHGEIKVTNRCGDILYCDYRATANITAGVHLVFLTDRTDQRRMEQALIDSELRYRNFFTHDPNGLLLINEEGVLLDVNPGIHAISGYTREELVGNHFSMLVDSNNQPDAERDTATLLELGELEKVVSVTHKSGEVREWMIKLTLMRPGTYLAYTTDITETRRHQRELQRARDYYLTLLDKFPTLVWRSGVNGLCDYFNDTWLAFTGRSMVEEIGNGWLEGVHPDDQEKCLNLYQQAFITRQPFRMEYRLRHNSGDYHWITDIGQPFNDLDGNFSGYLGSCFDITDRKDAEEQLRHNQNFLETVLENEPLAFSIMSLDGRYQRINAAFENLFGVGRENIVGKKVDVFFPPQVVQKILDELDFVATTRQQHWIERPMNVGGRHHDFLSLKFPIPTPQESEVGVFLVDITDLKHTQAELQAKVCDLEALYRAWQELSTAANLDQCLEIILRQALMIFPADRAWIRHHVAPGKIHVSRVIKRSPGDTGMLVDEPADWMAQLQPANDALISEVNCPVRDHRITVIRLVYGNQIQAELYLGNAIHELRGKEDDDQITLLELFAQIAATSIANQRYHQATLDRLTEMTVVNRLGQRLQKLMTLDQLGKVIIEVLHESMHYEYCAVLVRNRQTDELITFAMDQNDPTNPPITVEEMNSQGFRVGKGVIGWVVEHGKSQIINDVTSDPRFITFRNGIQSEMCVPIKTGERIFGAINVESTKPNAYSGTDLLLLETIATQLSIAIQNSQLLQSLTEQRQRLRRLSFQLSEVEEAERKRLANELHDQVGQNLSAIGLNLNLAKSMLTPEQMEGPGARLDDSLTMLEETVRSIRTVMLDLRPSILDDYGLPAALRWLGEQFSRRTGIEVTYREIFHKQYHASGLDNALFRISQEALTNILKHAQADHVTITLEVHNESTRLIVDDNGKGFINRANRNRHGGTGWGISIMRERAEALGGNLYIETGPEHGARILVTMPNMEGKE